MTRTLTRAGLDRGIDQLFASVAASFAQRAVVLVLSGAGWDGGDGVCAVRAQNGIVLVQDQTTASQASMLRTAISTGCADLVLRLEDIAPVLVSLVRDGYPLATLRRSAAAMVSGRSSPIPTVLRDTLDQLLATALWIHGTEMGNIQLFDPETGNLSIIAQRGFGFDFLAHFGVVSSDDESACGRAMRTRAPVFIPDVDSDPLFAPHRDIARAAGFRAVQSTPLISRNGTFLGVLSSHFPSPYPLSQTQLHWLHHRSANNLIEQIAYRTTPARTNAMLSVSH